MKHILEQTVYYADTDSYGVVWHGTYLRWMEMARVEMCRELGLDLNELKANNIVIPVTNINIRYKASAKIDERIYVETTISKMTPFTFVFTQFIKNKETEKIYTQAEVEVVAVNTSGRIYRKMPEVLVSACKKAMNEVVCQG